MKIYKIETYSALHMISILLSSITIVVLLTTIFIDGNNAILFLSTLFICSGIAWYLANKASKAIVNLQINEIGIELSWTEQFWLSRKKNIVISWQNIKSYEFERVNTYITLKLVLNDDSKFRLPREMGANDEFDEFKTAFKEKAKQFKISESH